MLMVRRVRNEERERRQGRVVSSLPLS